MNRLREVLSYFVLFSLSLTEASTNVGGLNWYESLPAVAMDYKVHVDAGKIGKKHDRRRIFTDHLDPSIKPLI